MRKALVLGCLIAVACALPAMAGGMDLFGPPQTFTERTSGALDRTQRIESELALNTRLTGDQVTAGLANPLVVRAAAADLARVAEPQAGVVPLRVGTMAAAEARVDLGSLAASPLAYRSAMALPFGAVALQGRNGFVWSGAVESPGASALRVHLTGVSLPAGVELYVYNKRGEAHGPYQVRGGEVWTHTVQGSSLLLQARYSGADLAGALAGTRFQVAGVGHLTEKFLIGLVGSAASEEGLATRSFCSFNESCVENAACSSIPGPVAAAEDAIAEMLFASGAYLYICTGGLLADMDSSTQIPYFLTANHCISKGREADSLETFFQFTTNCNGPCYDFETAGLPGTVGASIVAKNRTSDYTLLQLDDPAPAGSAFLGWDSAPVAFSNGTALYRLSHPSGAPQAYSEHEVDTSKTTCSSWPRGGWIYSQDIYGATEGGSSGSPVLNSSGQVVGQLSGACGFNVNDPCDAASNATVDGAFANYYADVAGILGGGGPGGGCTLLPQGASCVNDSDCCSNKCKGPSGGKTCK